MDFHYSGLAVLHSIFISKAISYFCSAEIFAACGLIKSGMKDVPTVYHFR